MIRVVSVAGGNEVAGARILARTSPRITRTGPSACSCCPGVRPTLHPGEEPFEVLDPTPGAAGRAPGRPAGRAARGARAAAAGPPRARRGRRARAAAPARRRAARAARRARAATHAALLVPRLLGGLPQDGERPDSRDLLDAGEIDDELVAVRGDRRGPRVRRAGGSSAGARTRRPPAPTDGTSARPAPSPLAAALGSFDGRRAGSRIPPTTSPTGTSTSARSRDARLVRFAGFRADRPWWLSEHASRTLVLDDPALVGGGGPARAGAARRRLGGRGRGRRRRPRSCPAAWSGTTACGACTRRRSTRARTSATSTRRPARARSRAG